MTLKTVTVVGLARKLEARVKPDTKRLTHPSKVAAVKGLSCVLIAAISCTFDVVPCISVWTYLQLQRQTTSARLCLSCMSSVTT